MTGGPSAGPSSAYPTFNPPASICLSEANDVCGAGGGVAPGVDVQLATDVAATASPTVRAKSRRVITGDMFDRPIWTCKSSRSADCTPDVCSDEVVHVPGDLGRVAHDVVAVVDAAHLHILGE